MAGLQLCIASHCLAAATPVQDLLKVLAITTDDPRLERVQQDHLLRLTGKSDRNEVADLLRWNE